MEVLDILIHETEVQWNWRNVWVIVSSYNFENVNGFVHVLETFGEVLAGVVVEAEIGVAVGDNWWIISKQFLLDNDALGLELNCL